jgi:chemotaxis protein histidine kinase CheA
MLENKFQARKYRNEADADGASGGGSEDDAAKAAEADAAAKEEVAAEAKAKEAAEAKAGESNDAVDDGKPSEREAELLKETMQRKAQLKEKDQTISEMQKQLKAWEGLNPDEVKSLVQAQKDAETRKLEEKGQFEKVKEQMNEAHQAELQTLQEQIEALNKEIAGRDNQIEDLSVGNTFSASKFIADELTLPVSKARTLYGAHFERGEDGKIVGYDKPMGSEGRAPYVNASGEPLAFDAALKKIVDSDPDKDSLYRSKAKPGAGSGTDAKAGSSGEASQSLAPGRDRIKAAIDSGGLQPAKGLDLPT